MSFPLNSSEKAKHGVLLSLGSLILGKIRESGQISSFFIKLGSQSKVP